MKTISDSYIRIIQGFNIFVIGLWCLLFPLFWFIDKSPNTLLVFFIGIIVWGIISFLTFKLREVKISSEDIILLNLFSKLKFKKDDFRGIEKTIFSPLVYKISFDNARNYYFLMKIEDVFTSTFITLGTGSVIDKMNKMIKG